MKTGRNNNNRNREMGKIKENWFGKMRFSGRGAGGLSADTGEQVR